MSAPVVFDVETQMTFREAGGPDPRKLKISVVGMYDYASDQYLTFVESELPKFFHYLENASLVIGFNTIHFDLPALSPYYVGKLDRFASLDLLAEIEKVVGFRISLDDLAKETLGSQKTGHGLMAIEYFKSGQMDKLKEYCLSDVKLTKELYEYGKLHKKVFYLSKTGTGRQEIPINWGDIVKPSAQVNLTLPW